MNRQPNILLILSDQHNPHVLGCAGDARGPQGRGKTSARRPPPLTARASPPRVLVRTPNLDRLAARGVLFEKNYCPSPLCVPSRMSFVTARQCSEIRVWSNGCVLASDIPTFMHGLGAAGYENILCGRMHFTGADQRHGFHRRIIGDVDGNLGHIPRVTTGQTKPCVETAGPGRTAYSAYDDAVTRTACDFLKERGGAGAARPFFLSVGYVLPHCPYIAPKRLFDEYFDRVDVPQLPPGYLESLHPAMRLWRQHRGVDELTDAQVRTARAAYYGLVTYMDERIGEVLQALDESGLAQDTIIVYTSDHGDMAGEHRMWWKSSFYEGSVGAPLILSWPGRFPAGWRVARVTSLVDLGPTLLELAGAPPIPFASGRSFAGFLSESGEVPGWPDQAFAEYCGLLGDRPAFMVRKGPWKLNYYHGYDTPQLFNLEEDPGEFRDRAGDPACAAVRNELMEIVRRSWSGDFVENSLKQRAASRDFIRKWWATAPPGVGREDKALDRWKAPPDCNVFPET